MTQDTLRFLQILFDPDDFTCFSSDPYGVSTTAVMYPRYHQYFCINALIGKRADHNVIKYRTFLIEFDELPLSEQDTAMTLPYTAKVFSGNKSNHYFITLETPVTPAEYAEIAKRIHMAVPQADKSTKNPSRLARLAGAYNIKTGRMQEIIKLNHRIPNEQFMYLLPPLPAPKPVDAEERSQFVSSVIIAAKHAPDEVMEQMHIKGRNNFFHWLGQRLLEGNYGLGYRLECVDTAYANLRNKAEFDLQEARHAARVSK